MSADRRLKLLLWSAVLIRILLGGIFLYAGTVKASASEEFALALAPFTILPESWTGTFAVLLAWTELADEPLWRRGGFAEVPGLRLGDALGFLVVKPHLNRGVAVLVGVLGLKDAVAARLDDGGGCAAALVVIDAGHSEFFSE